MEPAFFKREKDYPNETFGFRNEASMEPAFFKREKPMWSFSDSKRMSFNGARFFQAGKVQLSPRMTLTEALLQWSPLFSSGKSISSWKAGLV